MTEFKQLTSFLVDLGIEKIGHTQKNYLAHLISVYKLMESQGCTEELCRAGMFHSIYGTERFRGFTLPVERRQEIQALIGERAERLVYLNCFMVRDTLDRALEMDTEPYPIRLRTGEEFPLAKADFDDLCRVHLFDWLEQVPRSQLGWGHRRDAFQRMKQRLGGKAEETYERVFAQETAAANAG
jgi:hypothetical protein